MPIRHQICPLGACAASLLVGALIPASFVFAAKSGDECNAYYPTPPGARWVFTIEQGSAPPLRQVITVRSATVSGEARQAELDQAVSVASTGAEAARGKASRSVRCGPDGVSLEVNGAADATPGESKSRVKARMLALPPEEKLAVGYTWRSASEIETREGGQSLRAEGARGSKVAAIEPVEVPAGRFSRALKIVSVEKLTLSGPVAEGASATSKRELRSEIVEWYARGLGLVKRESKAGGTITVEKLAEFSGLDPER